MTLCRCARHDLLHLARHGPNAKGVFMHARRFSLAIAMASVVGLGIAPAVHADDSEVGAGTAPGPSMVPTPGNGANGNVLPQTPGGRTLILIPDTPGQDNDSDDNDSDRASPDPSSGTLLILIPRRAPGTTAPTPDATMPDTTPQSPGTTPQAPDTQQPLQLPGRRTARTIEA
jgi:hypothetical protein